MHEGKVELKIVPFGLTQEDLHAAAQAALQSPHVQKYLKGTRHRLLSIEALAHHPEEKKPEAHSFSDHYLATVYDYTNTRTLLITGSISKKDVSHIEESGMQPLPSGEEFAEAVKILQRDPSFSSPLKARQIVAYPAMPPLIREELPDGRTERIIGIILVSSNPQYPHEVIGVHMSQERVIRYEGGAPPTSTADPLLCGVAPVYGETSPKGTPGQARFEVTYVGKVIWTFEVVRPAASSGTNGSGAELRFVDYKGKRVLYRAHVPILNVKYDNDACGPYRDWQWSEHVFQAEGTDVAPDIRLCTSPAQTILDTNSDAGNFHGVAVYVDGLEVVIVTEMQAGWYRYVQQWRLHVDGTIKPRFGFGAVSNSCVCKVHHHHVYWRFDFDIETAGNNYVQEYNNPSIFPDPNEHYHTKYYEIRRLKDANHHRHWEVKNATTNNGYKLLPGSNDGVADSAFGVGDLWVLRYHGNELDDGQLTQKADLDKFLTGESVYHQDVVLWYAAHFTHDVHNEGANEIVGPDLKVVKW